MTARTFFFPWICHKKTVGTARKVIEAFDKHFISRRNIIYERACLNQRRQSVHESVEESITDQHRLADSCDFGTLELIRDTFVVELRDKAVCLELQMDGNPTAGVCCQRSSKRRVSEAGTEGCTGDVPPRLAAVQKLKRSMNSELRDEGGLPTANSGRALRNSKGLVKATFARGVDKRRGTRGRCTLRTESSASTARKLVTSGRSVCLRRDDHRDFRGERLLNETVTP